MANLEGQQEKRNQLGLNLVPCLLTYRVEKKKGTVLTMEPRPHAYP